MAVTVSENGWSLRPPRRARTIVSDNSSIRLTVRNGPGGDLLLWFAGQLDMTVEDLDMKSTRGEYDDWSYAEREIRGGRRPSNHFSGSAFDMNATRHPLAAVNTFTPGQRVQIRALLNRVRNLIRWGGDYTGRRDEMHFELAPGSTDAQCASVLAAIQHAPTPTPVGSSGTLQVGSRGSEVERLQKLLNAKFPLYSKLVVDGDFGPGTEAVVREFQRRSRLEVDGRVGPVTRRSLGF